LIIEGNELVFLIRRSAFAPVEYLSKSLIFKLDTFGLIKESIKMIRAIYRVLRKEKIILIVEIFRLNKVKFSGK